MTPAPPTLSIANLSRHYGTLHAVRNISFDVQQGEIFGLLGPNGAGKTTTLECILGLRRPDSEHGGTIQVAGIDAQAHPAQARAALGAQLQTTALHDKITPRQALKLFASFYDDPENIDTLLNQFDLTPVATRTFDTLSGGTRQRLALALALVSKPQVLLLDEPTAGLDPQARRQTHAAIQQLKSAGKTILLTTHYIEEAHQLCDRVAIIHQGAIAAIGTPAELIARAKALPRILLRTARPLDTDSLTQLEGVTTSTSELRTQNSELPCRLSTANLPKTLAALIHHLESTNNALLDLQIQHPTLEDVFLELTGSPFSAQSPDSPTSQTAGEPCAA